jgi:hypothetical protein
LAQLLKAAPTLPDLRRQPWLVCDEASGESSEVQSRAKRLCRAAGLSRFSTHLVGQTSGLAIEYIESVHLVHLLEPNRSCEFADEAQRGRRDGARPIDGPRHWPRRPQVRAWSARPEAMDPQLRSQPLARRSIRRKVHRNDDPITRPLLFGLLRERGCDPLGETGTLCRQRVAL